MSLGNVLIYLSLVLALIGIITSFLRLKTKDAKFILYSRVVTISMFITISITLLYLYILFITSDVSIEYVWKYTNTDHLLKYKLSGVLAGMAGSLLFWVWFIIAPWFYEEMKMIKRSVNKEIADWTRIALFIVIAVLLFILSMHNLFKPTSSNLLALYPNGQGLNPLLQTDLMVIHPPIVFFAYGFLALPFAAALAYLISGHKDWLTFSLKWSRLGWLFLTLGIGIGAIWAYIVLGWGGYWGWDPVETSSLLPWILLTGFLHAQLMYKRKNDYMLLAPIMGVLSFVLVIFATFVTRAGGLWVSVHTFGQADVQIDPWQRFINILGENQTVLTYMIFIIVSLVITSFLVFHRYNKVKKERKERFYTLSGLINDEILMLTTIFLSVIITIVTFVLLVSSVNGLNPGDFNAKVGILSIIIVLTLIFCLLWKYTGRKWISLIGAGVLIASAIGFIFFPEIGAVTASMPILIVALIGTFYKISRTFNFRKPIPSMKISSAHLIHLAIVLLLMGYIASNYLVVEESIALSIGGDGKQVSDYTIKVVNIESSADRIFVDIEAWKGTSLIGRGRPGLILIGEETRNEIKIIDTLTEDIYLTYEQINEDVLEQIESVDINVKVIPLIKFVWGGMWLMAIGITIRMVTEKLQPSGKELKKRIKGTHIIKDDKYYEDVVEEELKS